MKWNKSRKDLAKNSLAVFVILLVSILGVRLLMSSQAAINDTLSLTSTSTNLTPGTNFSVTIMENSGTTPVNAVQASLNYDPAQLQYVSKTEEAVFTTTAAFNTATPGIVRVSRATSTPVTGSQKVITLTFKVLASSGTVGLSFDKNFSLLVRASDSADILGTVIGSNYTVGNGTVPTATASMSLTPSTGNQMVGTNFTVTVSENSGLNPVNSVQSAVVYDPTKLQYVSMTEGNVFPTRAATDTATPGRIRVARSIASGSAGISGTNQVVSITFKVLGNAGTTPVTVDKTQSFVVSSTTNTDILTTVGNASYTLTSNNTGTNAILSMSPSSGSFAQNAIVSVTLSANSPTTPITTVEAHINYPAAQLQFVDVVEGDVFNYLPAPRTNTSTPGVINLVRIRQGGDPGVTGIVPVVTINFRVIGTGGAIPLTYGTASAIYSDAGTNILNLAGSSPANYTVATTNTTCTANPSAPGALTRTATNYTTVTLSWTPSSPGTNCTLSGYQILRNGIQVGSATSGTSFTDTGLASGTSYNYTVRATDTAGHVSALSPAVSMATKADDVSPTTPVGINVAVPISSSSINLGWSPSTDAPNPGGTGVAGYQIFRNNSLTPTYTVTNGTSFADTNVTADTLYSYTVRAFDKVGNLSAPSSIVSARTAAAPVSCTGNPTTPSGLSSGTSTLNSVTFSWSPSTAATGCSLAGYRVFRNSQLVGSPTSNAFTDTGLAPGTSYSYTVQAYDTAAHSSTMSAVRTIVTAGDVTAPVAPATVTATAVSPGQVNIAWSASTDNVAVVNYKVYRGTSLVHTALAAALSFNDTNVTADTAYTYTVSAVDGSGNESTRTTATPNPVRTPVSNDTQAPTVPGNLRATAVTTNSVSLTWNASTDNQAVSGYRVYRGGNLLGNAVGLTYTDLTRMPDTNATYTVRAFDASGNQSAATPNLSVRTPPVAVARIADLDLDGDVDDDDLAILLFYLDTPTTLAGRGELNGDGIVNEDDLAILLFHLD